MKKITAALVLGVSSLMTFAANAGSWGNYGVGWPGTAGVPTLTIGGNIDLCTETLNISSSNPVATYAQLLIGLMPQDIPSNLDGTLLVVLINSLVIPLPAGGLSIPLGCLPEGFVVFLQVLESDPGATKGVSFTPGMILVQ